MLSQSLRALCLPPGGSGSVWKYLEAQVRSPGVSGRIACGFRTELHFADEFCMLFHLLFSTLRCDQYLLSCCEITPQIRHFLE